MTSAARFKKISLVADAYFLKLLSPFSDHFISTAEPPIPEPSKDEEVEIEVLDEYLDDIIEYDEYEEVPEVLKDDNVQEEEFHFIIPIETDEVDEKVVEVSQEVKKKTTGSKNVHECFCGAKFISAHRLNNHIKVRHTEIPEEEKLTCLTCGKKFKIQEYLELHIR